MKYLIGLTHSNREFDLQRCSVNFLHDRYRSNERLANLPPFDSLSGIAEHQPYEGSATFWIFDPSNPTTLSLVRRFEPGYKLQHAICLGDRFVLAAPDFVETRRPDGSIVDRYSDPWMAGVHTCFAIDDTLVVSCSASDSVLVVDLESGRVRDAFRLPSELYGTNYALKRTDDTRAHYIENDRQLTHINGAWPTPEGIYVSTFIGGLIGRFDWDGSYHEIQRGFVGCHGIRKLDDDRLLFSDSCLGCACLLDVERRSVIERIDFDSHWLHDTDTPDGRYFFGCLGDRNRVDLFDRDQADIIARWRMDDFGAGVQFLSIYALSAAGLGWLDAPGTYEKRVGSIADEHDFTIRDHELISLDLRRLEAQAARCYLLPDGSRRIVTTEEKGPYAAVSEPHDLEPSEFESYDLAIEASIERGAFSVGLLDVQRDTFTDSWTITSGERKVHTFGVPAERMPGRFRLVFSNHGVHAGESVFRLFRVRIHGTLVEATAPPA